MDIVQTICISPHFKCLVNDFKYGSIIGDFINGLWLVLRVFCIVYTSFMNGTSFSMLYSEGISSQRVQLVACDWCHIVVFIFNCLNNVLIRLISFMYILLLIKRCVCVNCCQTLTLDKFE